MTESSSTPSPAPPAKKKDTVVIRDPLTGGITRAPDYLEVFEAFKEQDAEKFTPREGRFYASNAARCLRQTVWKMTGRETDDGAKGFDDGVGERGNAVEDRFTLQQRGVIGPDAVLQNVRITKRIQIKHPVSGEPFTIVIVCKSDPIVIGDNLEVLKIYEVKSTNAFFQNSPLSYWVDDEGMNKIPLFMAKVDEKDTLDIVGAAKLHNLSQLAFETQILRESGREPKQSVLIYIKPDNLKTHLEILVSRTDAAVLADLGEQFVKQVFHYVLSGEMPPALYAMPWECRATYCDWKNQCALVNKERKEERRLNPLFGSVNLALEKARKAAQEAKA